MKLLNVNKNIFDLDKVIELIYNVEFLQDIPKVLVNEYCTYNNIYTLEDLVKSYDKLFIEKHSTVNKSFLKKEEFDKLLSNSNVNYSYLNVNKKTALKNYLKKINSKPSFKFSLSDKTLVKSKEKFFPDFYKSIKDNILDKEYIPYKDGSLNGKYLYDLNNFFKIDDQNSYFIEVTFPENTLKVSSGYFDESEYTKTLTIQDILNESSIFNHKSRNINLLSYMFYRHNRTLEFTCFDYEDISEKHKELYANFLFSCILTTVSLFGGIKSQFPFNYLCLEEFNKLFKTRLKNEVLYYKIEPYPNWINEVYNGSYSFHPQRTYYLKCVFFNTIDAWYSYIKSSILNSYLISKEETILNLDLTYNFDERKLACFKMYEIGDNLFKEINNSILKLFDNLYLFDDFERSICLLENNVHELKFNKSLLDLLFYYINKGEHKTALNFVKNKDLSDVEFEMVYICWYIGLELPYKERQLFRPLFNEIFGRFELLVSNKLSLYDFNSDKSKILKFYNLTIEEAQEKLSFNEKVDIKNGKWS